MTQSTKLVRPSCEAGEKFFAKLSAMVGRRKPLSRQFLKFLSEIRETLNRSTGDVGASTSAESSVATEKAGRERPK
jgi:hypothetical protein